MYYKVFYNHTRWPLKSWAAAVAMGPLIFIRPGREEDWGLLKHEKIHVEQFWRSPFRHGPRYLCNRQYRLDCEVEAYRVQIDKTLSYSSDWTREQLALHYANSIATRYGLKITRDAAYLLLMEGHK